MADVICAKCREPWDFYGVKHGDMEEWEARRFLRGEGCPSCNWGESGEIGDFALEAAEMECEASDGDPMEILNRRF